MLMQVTYRCVEAEARRWCCERGGEGGGGTIYREPRSRGWEGGSSALGNIRGRGGNNLPRASFERVGRRFKCLGNIRERGGNNLPRASFERVGRRFKCLEEHKRERG